jgi:nucleotide-binding universal stress UspA family protein
MARALVEADGMAHALTSRMVSIKKILVPIDLGETSNHALDYAIDLAKALGASVTVAHSYVIPVYAFPDGAIISSPELAAKLSDAAQKNLDAAVNARKERGVEITSILTNGVPSDEVTRLAQELRADLIVMGTHGRRGLPRALLGSVAETVIRTSSIPVLAIHGPPDVS